MRPFILVGALSIALVASRGAAQGASPPEGKTSDPHPAAEERGKDIKGYGYGEQPGKSDTAAKQEAGADRERSAAPQDDRPSSGEARAAGSATATGEEDRSVVGRVVKAGAKSLSIRDEEKRVSRLRVDAKTRFLRDGKQVPVKSLKAGEEVRAAYDTRGGQRVATTITVVEKGASEPPSHTDQARQSERRQEGEPDHEHPKATPPGR